MIKKPEPSNVRGTCVLCNKRQQMSRGKGLFRAICNHCHIERHNMTERCRKNKRKRAKPYRVHKKSRCEACGFVPEHPCQLDVDHIDANHKNNDVNNLQTLCANCHRLKTFKERQLLL